MVGVSNGLGQGTRSGNPADRVMEAFGSVDLGGTGMASPGLIGGGAMASPIQTSSEGVGSLMGGIGSNGGGAVGVGMTGRGHHNQTGLGLGYGSGGGGLMGASPMQQLSPGRNPQQVGLGAGMGLGMGGVSGGMGGVGMSGGAASGLSGGMSIGRGGGGVGLGKPGTHGGVGMVSSVLGLTILYIQLRMFFSVEEGTSARLVVINDLVDGCVLGFSCTPALC